MHWLVGFLGVRLRSKSIKTSVITDHLGTEEALRPSETGFTILRDSLYAEVVVTMMAPPALATGKWIMSTDAGRIALITKQDCVDVAAMVLTTS